MLATLGDLVEDIVVRLRAPLHAASDTPAEIGRRRGGSAANVAATAGGLGAPVRFLGQVGDDSIGELLVDELTSDGVDTSMVRRSGTTGTIVVLVDEAGERSMLTDRRACTELIDPTPAWLDGVTTLHVPFYSLVGEPLATTARTTVGWAHEQGIEVSIDASSVALIENQGVAETLALLAELAPTVLFANEDEARVLGLDGALGKAVTVVKRGPAPAIVHTPGGPAIEIAAVEIAEMRDSTGAGDAFAAGFLSQGPLRSGSQAEPEPDLVAACHAAHRAAADVLMGR